MGPSHADVLYAHPNAMKSTTSRRNRAPLVFAWVATAASAFCAVLPAVIGRATYDPLVALAAVSAVALVWYTYFTREGIEDARLRQNEEEERKRQSLATAVLAELARLIPRLQRIYESGSSAATPEFISSPALERATNEAELFTPRSVQSLFNVRRMIEDVRAYLLELIRIEATKSSGVTNLIRGVASLNASERENAVKTRAGWAFNSAAELVPLLMAEGGLMPDAPAETSVLSPSEVPLLRNPFE